MVGYKFLVLLPLMVLSSKPLAQSPPMPTLFIEPQSVTISGVSSGAFMAVQMQVAFSQLIVGSATVADGPFWCAEGDAHQARTKCMGHPEGIRPVAQIQKARDLAARGDVDDLSFLTDRRLYVFASTRDRVVKSANSERLIEFYSAFTNRSQIRFVQNNVAAHGFPTLNYGALCGLSLSPWLQKCQLDTAGEILQTMYGPLNPRRTQRPKHLHKFDQTPIHNSQTALFNEGWIYIPSECAQGRTCKLHMALHGCKMNPEYVQDQFARFAGYNEWAESNHIVVLYPQAAKLERLNPFGCWDWFGFTGQNYATKQGPQPSALRSMIHHVSGF